jgi:hypothetical protein
MASFQTKRSRQIAQHGQLGFGQPPPLIQSIVRGSATASCEALTVTHAHSVQAFGDAQLPLVRFPFRQDF